MLFLVIMPYFVIGATPTPATPAKPTTTETALTPQDIVIIDNIQAEGKTNRKFTSDELTRQREQLLREVDDRANYYEKQFNDMISTAVLKLGLLWGGIVFIITGLNTFLLRKLERRRYKMLLDSVMKHSNPAYKSDNTKMMDKFAKDEADAKKIFNQQFQDTKDIVEQYKTGEMKPKPNPIKEQEQSDNISTRTYQV